MISQLELWPSDYRKETSEHLQEIFTPKLVIISGSKIVIQRYQNTKWHYLIGGKLNTNEIFVGVDLLHHDIIPPLKREVFEETGVLLNFPEDRFHLLGLAEYWKIDEVEKKVIFTTSSVLAINMQKQEDILLEQMLESSDFSLFDISDNPGGKLIFPADRCVIQALQKNRQGKFTFPAFLTNEKIIFQMKPEMKLLPDFPDWYKNATIKDK